jgi:hypothetical protein
MTIFVKSQLFLRREPSKNNRVVLASGCGGSGGGEDEQRE